jgi:hypothetical protein
MKHLLGRIIKPVSRFLVKSSGLLPKPVNLNDREGILSKSWGYVFSNRIKGAYYEFGLYKGDSFVRSWTGLGDYKKWLYSQASSPELWRRDMLRDFASYRQVFYGFDTFRGMPENKEYDGERDKVHDKGNFCGTREEVEEKCKKLKMNYRLYEGDFADLDASLFEKLEPAAIINIDSDLYASAKTAMEKVHQKFQQGTILLMDDYNIFRASDAKGERRALREFCEKYEHIRFEPWQPYYLCGQSFICHTGNADE